MDLSGEIERVDLRAGRHLIEKICGEKARSFGLYLYTAGVQGHESLGMQDA